jgi:Cu/Ag efflux protein CusF
VRILLAVLVLTVVASCGGAKHAPVRTCELRGQVLRLDPQLRTATIKHQKICDWMEAMTMEFPVRSQRDFNTLKVGERITATVYIGDPEFWIGDVRAVP